MESSLQNVLRARFSLSVPFVSHEAAGETVNDMLCSMYDFFKDRSDHQADYME